MGLVVEHEMTVSVHIASFIHKLNDCGSGNDSKGAGDGFCIVHDVAEVIDQSQLRVQAVVKFRHILDVFAVSHSFQQELAIISEAKVQIDDLLVSFLTVRTVQIGLCIQIHVLQSIPGVDIIAVPVFLELQFYLGCIGGNHHDASADRGIVIRIGNHCQHQVCAGVGVTDIVLEGQVSGNGQLLHNRNNFIDVFSVHFQFDQSFTDAIRIV